MKVTMSNAARISCALVFVTLAICLESIVADPKSTSGVALTTMHSPHSPAAINRHLRHTAAMETTEAFEERAPTLHFSELAPSFSSLKSITAAIYQKIQSWVWRMTRKSSDDVFKLLKLDTEETNLFGDLRFMRWATFVSSRYSEDPTAATEAMLKTLVNHYGEGAALAKILVAGKKTDSVKSVAGNLLWLQLSRWREGKETVGELFTLLELEKIGKKLFESPLFSLWVTIVELRYSENPKAAIEVILSTLAAHYGEDAALADALIVGINNPNMTKFAVNLLRIQLQRWCDTEKTVESVFTDLNLESIGEGLFESPQMIMWLGFVGSRYRVVDNEANKSAKKAIHMAPFEAALTTLRLHYDDDMLRKILAKGSKINDKEIKKIADKLDAMLTRKLTTGRS
ncbi:unnamed protein product [Peronospora farinosa]|uniref:Uncharacterized protein n=1 Tax=Peronospora farinosa TaxID=134698 RepID=A0AAV0UCB7_9STRA|nr:unnamed protein product [Peronospora farinosa]